MQRSKTATDPGALEQAAAAVISTAPTGKHRSKTQHLYAKHSNSHRTPWQTVTSTISHPTLVVDRRATRPASPARIARARAMEPSGAHHPNVTRRTAARPSVPQTKGKPTFIQEHGFASKPTTPPLKSSLKDGKGSKVKFVKSQRSVGKVHRVQTKKDNDKPDAVVQPPAGQQVSAAPSTSSTQPSTSTQSRRREEEYHGYSREEPRPRFEGEHKSTPHLNPRGQSSKVSDSLPESRNGIATAFQKTNLESYQLRRVFYDSATPNKQYHHDTCTTPTRT